MKLYDSVLSPFTARCRIQMRAKGLIYESVLMTHPLPEDYKRRNPIGKIPSLEVDGWIIPESSVIAEYLEDVYSTPSLRPEAPKERALMRLLVRIADLYVMVPMQAIFAQMTGGEHDAKAIADALAGIANGLEYLEFYLGREGGAKTYAVGDRLSLADCALAPVLHYAAVICPLMGDSEAMRKAPRTAAYLEAVCQDARVKPAMEELKASLAAALKR